MGMKERHGGDIYRNKVNMDFSVNVNPFGMPVSVRQVMEEAVQYCEQYPDIRTEKLKKAMSNYLSVPESYLLFGNGASELFMGIVHALKPKKTVIPVPSFYGYEYATEAEGGEIIYYQMPLSENFSLGKDFYEVLTKDIDLLFLANPNNPTGALLERDMLIRIMNYCKEQGIYVVLDECFIEFCKQEASMISILEEYDNLLLVRAFTKSFAIPGVRLGYLVCSNEDLVQKIQRHLPEWNLSVLAQVAGIACSKESAYLAETVKYVEEERRYLTEKLSGLGLKVFPSEANFLLIYSEKPLYEKLLERGILIRDCENFRGLSKGFYRVVIRQRKENEQLWKVIGECIV